MEPCRRIAFVSDDPIDAATAEACFDLLVTRASVVPEERLMLALLLDAVVQLQRRGTTSAAAAASWIRGDEGMTGAAVSFVAVCESLGVDAAYLARGLLRTGEDRAATSLPRPRPRPALAAAPRRRVHPARATPPLLLLWMIVLHGLARAPLWVRLVALAVVPLAVGGLSALVLP